MEGPVFHRGGVRENLEELAVVQQDVADQAGCCPHQAAKPSPSLLLPYTLEQIPLDLPILLTTLAIIATRTLALCLPSTAVDQGLNLGPRLESGLIVVGDGVVKENKGEVLLAINGPEGVLMVGVQGD